jgi:hypothetical protein
VPVSGRAANYPPTDCEKHHDQKKGRNSPQRRVAAKARGRLSGALSRSSGSHNTHVVGAEVEPPDVIAHDEKNVFLGEALVLYQASASLAQTMEARENQLGRFPHCSELLHLTGGCEESGQVLSSAGK